MGITSGAYKVLLVLHLVAVVVAFGPLFAYPVLRRAGQTALVARFHVRAVLPALVAVWVLGMGLAGLSDDVWELSEPWLALSILVWLVLVAIAWFVVRPALEDPSPQGGSRLAMGTGVSHGLMVVALYLMVFKPGA